MILTPLSVSKLGASKKCSVPTPSKIIEVHLTLFPSGVGDRTVCVRLFINVAHALFKSRAVTSYDVWLASIQSNSLDLSFRQSEICTYVVGMHEWRRDVSLHLLGQPRISLPDVMASDRCGDYVIGLIDFCLRYCGNKQGIYLTCVSVTSLC